MAGPLDELREVIAAVTSRTGDPAAWRTGLTDTELSAVATAAVDPAALRDVIAAIKAHHPTVFAGAPTAPQGQRGAAAAAMKKAEDNLAQQNSSTAQLDLHVIGAILNAHSQAVAGAERLFVLQQQIETAVESRTDLDTPAGARDFQRFLIGKLREIGAVVESANLDDSSKAALAAAWTALYASSTPATDTPAAAAPRAAPAAASPAQPPAPGAAPPISAEPLPPYGADLAPVPISDAAVGPPVPPPSPAPAVPMNMPAPALPSSAPPALPLPTGAPGPSWGGTEAQPRSGPASESLPADLGLADIPLDDLLGDESEADDTTEPEDDPAEDTPDTPAADPDTTVRLPDGTTTVAPTPALAGVIRAAVAGTPIPEAFRAQGITLPAPGTAVPDPVDPSRISTGDVGMFTDRQALALDTGRALFNGKIEPVASVSGPSFLGWWHPPTPGATTPSAQDPPTGADPPQTRPASAAATPDRST